MERRCGSCLWKKENRCCFNPPVLVMQKDITTWQQPKVEDSDSCSQYKHYRSEDCE